MWRKGSAHKGSVQTRGTKFIYVKEMKEMSPKFIVGIDAEG